MLEIVASTLAPDEQSALSQAAAHLRRQGSDSTLPSAGVLPRPSFWPHLTPEKPLALGGGSWADLVIDDPTAGDSERGSPWDVSVATSDNEPPLAEQQCGASGAAILSAPSQQQARETVNV